MALEKEKSQAAGLIGLVGEFGPDFGVTNTFLTFVR